MYDGELFVQLEPVKLAPDTIGWKAKRTFDVFIASLTLFIASPLFMIVVALIKLTGQGPVFSRQICVGRGGRPFACLTFRTMVKDAGTVPQAFRHSDQATQTEWERTQRLVNGPRITPVGRVLRQSSLDKLPQFINVIRGDMSLVGPSPIVPSEVARYGDGLGWYLRVRPGMTGLFQVSGRKGARYDQRIEMEADYVRNWRFATDLMLLLRTLGADAAHQA